VRAANPHIQFFNSQDWGYSTVEFNRWYCEYTAYKVDKTVNQTDAPRSVLRRLRVPRGWVRLLDVAT
jgi:alkaline phosphatase D